jgi:hypothetical protein
MGWKKLLETASESINDHFRLRNDYLMVENRILRNQIEGRVQLTDSERKEFAEIGTKLGKKALAEIATVAQPETILAWNRKFANQSTDTSKRPQSGGRPRVDNEIGRCVKAVDLLSALSGGDIPVPEHDLFVVAASAGTQGISGFRPAPP